MALNHTGIPEKQIEGYDLTTDAYKAFDELLYSDLINQQNKNSINILILYQKHLMKITYKMKLSSMLN